MWKKGHCRKVIKRFRLSWAGKADKKKITKRKRPVVIDSGKYSLVKGKGLDFWELTRKRISSCGKRKG